MSRSLHAIVIANPNQTALVIECADQTKIGQVYNLWGPIASGRVVAILENDGYALPSIDNTASAQVERDGVSYTGKVTNVIDVDNVEIYGIPFKVSDVVEFLPPSHYVEENLTPPAEFRAVFA